MTPTRVDQRDKVAGVQQSGAKPEEISGTLDMAQSTLFKTKERHDETGSVVDCEGSHRLVL